MVDPLSGFTEDDFNPPPVPDVERVVPDEELDSTGELSQQDRIEMKLDYLIQEIETLKVAVPKVVEGIAESMQHSPIGKLLLRAMGQ